MQGIGAACPINIDSANNDLTGRDIKSNEVKELIVQLHNEVRKWLSNSMKLVVIFPQHFLSDKNSQVRSKIARGACDQPKAGCMGPVVSCWEMEMIYK